MIRHLSGHQHVDLAPVIFVVSEALIYLRTGEIGENVGTHDTIHRLAILKQADDIMHADAGALHPSMAAAHTRGANDVAIAGGDGVHGRDREGEGRERQGCIRAAGARALRKLAAVKPAEAFRA